MQLEGSWGHTIQFLWQNNPVVSCWWKKGSTLCRVEFWNKISILVCLNLLLCKLWALSSCVMSSPSAWVPTAPGQGGWGLGNPEAKILSPACMWITIIPDWAIREWDIPWRILGSEERRRTLAPIPSMCLPRWTEPAGWKQSLSSCLFAHVDNFCNVKATSPTQLLCKFLHMRSHCSGCSVCVLSFQLLDLHSWVLYVWKVKFLLETLS